MVALSPWEPWEILLLLRRVKTETIMKRTGRTRSAVGRARWEMRRERKHHIVGRACNCFCKRLNAYHCAGGPDHEKFMKTHKENARLKQMDLFKLF